MRVFVAEKPSLAAAIADGLGSKINKNGYYQCGNDAVTWCFGHLLELFEPQEYDDALSTWSKNTLPIIPSQWKKRLKCDAPPKNGKKIAGGDGIKRQIGIIKGLLSKADIVVNAGDPDREGQLLVDEVLEYLNWKGTTQRIWVNANDLTSMRKALAALKDNSSYRSLRDSAEARSMADWLIGMNMTRAMTVFGREHGVDGVLSQGRVQTPTLAIVVQRDMEIEEFKPHDFYTLEAAFTHQSGKYSGILAIPDSLLEVDSEGRIIDRAVADRLAGAVKGKDGKIVLAEKSIKKKSPPLPFSLASLQKSASAKYGMTAQDVLNTAQTLY